MRARMPAVQKRAVFLAAYISLFVMSVKVNLRLRVVKAAAHKLCFFIA